MDDVSAFKQNFQMSDQALKKLGAAIRQARRAKNVTLKALGAVVKVSPQAVGQWERGENGPSMANLITIGEFLGEDFRWGGGHPSSRPAPTQELTPAPDQESPLERFVGQDLPVLGITMGGRKDKRGPDFWMNGEVIRYAPRPRALEGRKDAFGLYVDGTSMEPRFFAGDMVIVEKRAPAPGDDVVVELKSDDPADEHDNPSFLKHFVARRGSMITVRQFNPKKELSFDLKEIKNLFRVIPVKELMS